VSGVRDLLIGIAVLVPALGSTFVLVWTTVVRRDKPEQVARSAAEETATAIVTALADGELSPEDVAAINKALRRREQPDDSQGGGQS
jgi:uncharacterized membrane protein